MWYQQPDNSDLFKSLGPTSPEAGLRIELQWEGLTQVGDRVQRWGGGEGGQKLCEYTMPLSLGVY